MMRARMTVEEPDKIEMTLKLTMTIQEWSELRDQLARAYPAWRLSTAITSMLTDARKIFFAPDEGKDALG